MDLLQNIFKMYLYPVDKTITLTHLDTKMILDFLLPKIDLPLDTRTLLTVSSFAKKALQNIFLRKPQKLYFYGRRKENFIFGDSSLPYSKYIAVFCILCTNIQHPQKYEFNH